MRTYKAALLLLVHIGLAIGRGRPLADKGLPDLPGAHGGSATNAFGGDASIEAPLALTHHLV